MNAQKLQFGFVKARMSLPGISEDGEFNVGMVEIESEACIAIVRAKDLDADVERIHLTLERSTIVQLLKDRRRVVLDITIASPRGQYQRSWSVRNVRRVLLCKMPHSDESGLWTVVLEGADGALGSNDEATLRAALEKQVQWTRPKFPLM